MINCELFSHFYFVTLPMPRKCEADRIYHRLRILIFCQNKMNFTTLKQMTNDETEPVEAKNLMQTSAKFCEVLALKISFFSLSTKLFRVICRSCVYFYHLSPHQLLLFCLFASASREKNHVLQSPGS